MQGEKGGMATFTADNFALAAAAPFVGTSPVTGEFSSQRASDADFHVSLMWVHITW